MYHNHLVVLHDGHLHFFFLDINECLDESVCAGGECLNTDGSFMCFCTHPMTLDPSRNQCVFSSDVPGIVSYSLCCRPGKQHTLICESFFKLYFQNHRKWRMWTSRACVGRWWLSPWPALSLWAPTGRPPTLSAAVCTERPGAWNVPCVPPPILVINSLLLTNTGNTPTNTYQYW